MKLYIYYLLLLVVLLIAILCITPVYADEAKGEEISPTLFTLDNRVGDVYDCNYVWYPDWNKCSNHTYKGRDFRLFFGEQGVEAIVDVTQEIEGFIMMVWNKNLKQAMDDRGQFVMLKAAPACETLEQISEFVDVLLTDGPKPAYLMLKLMAGMPGQKVPFACTLLSGPVVVTAPHGETFLFAFEGRAEQCLIGSVVNHYGRDYYAVMCKNIGRAG